MFVPLKMLLQNVRSAACGKRKGLTTGLNNIIGKKLCLIRAELCHGKVPRKQILSGKAGILAFFLPKLLGSGDLLRSSGPRSAARFAQSYFWRE
jgi:hypothetical protein